MKSIDASMHIKDAPLLCELLDEFFQGISVQHAQVIT
jgi:hypothetical protein